jgi:hypothetical protein
MGGRGSGRKYGHGKCTVEDCIRLDIGWLRRELAKGAQFRATFLVRPGLLGEPMNLLHLEGDTLAFPCPWVSLTYMIWQTKERARLRIDLQSTRPHYGGRRWWFTCPLSTANRVCRRRVATLLLPPGERVFGCRRCYGLTYASSQESPTLFGEL